MFTFICLGHKNPELCKARFAVIDTLHGVATAGLASHEMSGGSAVIKLAPPFQTLLQKFCTIIQTYHNFKHVTLTCYAPIGKKF